MVWANIDVWDAPLVLGVFPKIEPPVFGLPADGLPKTEGVSDYCSACAKGDGMVDAAGFEKRAAVVTG